MVMVILVFILIVVKQAKLLPESFKEEEFKFNFKVFLVLLQLQERLQFAKSHYFMDLAKEVSDLQS